jgi:hypothetical protein
VTVDAFAIRAGDRLEVDGRRGTVVSPPGRGEDDAVVYVRFDGRSDPEVVDARRLTPRCLRGLAGRSAPS